MKSTEAIGHPELTKVMQGALDEVEKEINRTLDVLEKEENQ